MWANLPPDCDSRSFCVRLIPAICQHRVPLNPCYGGCMRAIKNSSSFRPLVVLAALSLLIGCALPAAAQTQGRITGRVTDTSGAVIVGAKVTIENRGTGVKRTLDTNSSGDYVAPGLEPGIYSLSVEAPNFRKVVRDR